MMRFFEREKKQILFVEQRGQQQDLSNKDKINKLVQSVPGPLVTTVYPELETHLKTNLSQFLEQFHFLPNIWSFKFLKYGALALPVIAT